MSGECVLSDHGLLLFTKNNTCGQPLFYFSSDYLMKKNAEYHRYAYSDSLARAFEILWADQRDRYLKSKNYTVIVLVKLEVLNYLAILFCRWSRGLEQSDQLDV